MAIFVITLFAILLTLLPLQWQMPFDFFASQSRDPWNGPMIVLYTVSGCFYLIIFIKKKKWLQPTMIRGCFVAATLLISWWLLFDSRSQAGAIEVIRLLGIIWIIPVSSFAIGHLGTSRLLYLLVALLVIHAQWGILQFIAQDDLGLYVLGESRLDVNEPGIAKFAVSNMNILTPNKILRAYGPYPHPNSFGGALIVGYMAGLSLLLRKNIPALSLPIGFIFLALLLTFSRSAALATAVASAAFLYLHQTVRVKHEALPEVMPTILAATQFGSAETPYRRPLTYDLRAMAFWYWGKDLWGTLLFIIVTSLVFTPFWVMRLTDSRDVAATERLLGTRAAWQVIKDNPWFGVGIGQYTKVLQHWLDSTHQKYQPWQIAPVHSVPLLILAQIGVLGTLLVIASLLYYLRRLTWRQIIWLIPLIPLALFDHYLLTQVAPLVLVVLWLLVIPRFALSSYQHFPGAKQSTDS